MGQEGQKHHLFHWRCQSNAEGSVGPEVSAGASNSSYVEMGLKWLLQWCLMVMPTVTKQLLLVWFISTNTPTERSRARTASAGAIRQCRLKYQEYSGCWWIPLTNNWVGGEKTWSFITLFSFDCQLFRWFLLPHFSALSWSSLLMRHGIHDKL